MKKYSKYIWPIAFALFFIFCSTVIYLAYQKKIPGFLAIIPHYDYIGHFVLFGMLFYLLHRAIKRFSIKTIPLALILIGAFAIVEESLQIFSPNRTFDLLDLFLSLAGICFFYWIDKRFIAS
jgi:polysaccharide biosynthesis protein VpsQ